MSRVITVELDAAAEAALALLTATGETQDDAVRHALVVAAKRPAGVSMSGEATDPAADDGVGLA